MVQRPVDPDAEDVEPAWAPGGDRRGGTPVAAEAFPVASKAGPGLVPHLLVVTDSEEAQVVAVPADCGRIETRGGEAAAEGGPAGYGRAPERVGVHGPVRTNAE